MKKGESALGGKRRYLLLAIGFALGLGLLLYGSMGGGEEKTKTVLPEAESYRLALEEEIRTLCLGVPGVRDVTVLVSLEGGYEYLYATDKNGECVTVGSGSDRHAVVEQILPPEIGGIGIVCRGADGSLRAELTELLAAALGIGTNKIYITS